MRTRCFSSPQRGFALVITLALLALLVLSIYALSGLTRIGSQVATTGVYQVQARQNALLGLNIALGELQRLAGPDNRITSMAGITGVAAGANNPARQWCAVWQSDGSFAGWLASGGEGGTIPNLNGTDAILLVGTNSVGADATDREQTKALTKPITIFDLSGTSVTQGNYAYWVGDNGVKLSVVIPDADAIVSGQKQAINQQFAAISPTSTALDKIVSYEQLTLAGATTTQRQGGYHSYSRSHYGLSGSALKAGVLNVNSTSNRYWTGVGATYNLLRPGGITNLATFASRMSAAATWTTSGSDKPANGPFLSVTGFLTNAAVTNAVTGGGGTLVNFVQSMSAWMSVRSDTFVIRAYGDVCNPADSTKIESRAYCEAIVQRTIDPMSQAALGRRFIITYFRWLGPDDI